MKAMISKLTTIAVLLVSLQLPSFQASAQVTQANQDRLTEESRIRVIDGDPRFLIAELLKDGLLQEGVDIYVQYNDKQVALNQKDIPEPYNSTYVQMLLNGGFVHPGACTGSFRGGGETMSTLIQGSPSAGQRVRNAFRQHHNDYNRLTKLLVEDGIADKADDLTIDIAADYVAVNGRILKAPIEKTYEYHFRELSGFKPTEEEVFSIVVRHSPKN